MGSRHVIGFKLITTLRTKLVAERVKARNLRVIKETLLIDLRLFSRGKSSGRKVIEFHSFHLWGEGFRQAINTIIEEKIVFLVHGSILSSPILLGIMLRKWLR
jgi:hypothetical protein